MNPDPLADFAPELTPYRFSANNPIFFNDPSGLWEFTYDENSGRFALAKTSEDDDWKSFRKQSGLNNKELEAALGDNI